jgi:hypothetical protein
VDNYNNQDEAVEIIDLESYLKKFYHNEKDLYTLYTSLKESEEERKRTVADLGDARASKSLIYDEVICSKKCRIVFLTLYCSTKDRKISNQASSLDDLSKGLSELTPSIGTKPLFLEEIDLATSSLRAQSIKTALVIWPFFRFSRFIYTIIQVHGDSVVVEVLPQESWIKPSTKMADTGCTSEEMDETVENKIRPTGRVVGIAARKWRTYIATIDGDAIKVLICVSTLAYS